MTLSSLWIIIPNANPILSSHAKAKERGVYKNRKRKPVIDRNEVRKLKAEGLSTYKIADQMGISRMSVHRILNNAA